MLERGDTSSMTTQWAMPFLTEHLFLSLVTSVLLFIVMYRCTFI